MDTSPLIAQLLSLMVGWGVPPFCAVAILICVSALWIAFGLMLIRAFSGPPAPPPALPTTPTTPAHGGALPARHRKCD
jgi:hypothetical protein